MFIPASLSFWSVSGLLVFGPGEHGLANQRGFGANVQELTDCGDNGGLHQQRTRLAGVPETLEGMPRLNIPYAEIFAARRTHLRPDWSSEMPTIASEK